MSAVQGRVFTEGEALRNEAVAVISHAFHISRFGKNTSPLGVEIRLNGIPHTVVGIMPEEFDFPSLTQVWVPRFGRKAPLQTAPVQPAFFVSAYNSGFVGLLAEGVSPSQVENEIRSLLKRLHEEFTPKTGLHFGDTVSVRNLRERMGREARPALLVLFAGGLCVLLVAR